MGVYEIHCSECDKVFMWHSGNKHQICLKCLDEKFGGGTFEVYQKFKNPEPNHAVACYHFVGYNKADSYEDAIKLLIEKGVPEDEIVKKLFEMITKIKKLFDSI